MQSTVRHASHTNETGGEIFQKNEAAFSLKEMGRARIDMLTTAA
jgi:hypothetical protein